MASVKVVLRKFFMHTGLRSIVHRSRERDNRSSILEAVSYGTEAIADGDQAASASINNPAPDVDNEDPTKPHLRMPKHIGRIRRWWTSTRHFWKPEPTPMELELLEQTRKNMKIRNTMVRDMMVANQRLPTAYANLGIEYQRSRTKDKYENSKPQRVHFCKWLYSADGNTIFGKVDRTPYGFNPVRLVDEDVLTALTVSMGHPCGGRLDPNGGGVVISVALAGTMDIDDMFAFNKALELISESAPPLTYMVGATANGGRKTYNLEEMPHLLIAGTTGSGKSVALRSIAATFIARNSPDNVKLLMADLKRMDLVQFEGIPHLVTEIKEIPTGIVIEDRQIIIMLKWLEAENNKRQNIFSAGGVHSLPEWNRKHQKRKLPRIILFVDELARLMRRKDTSKEFTELAYDLASTARATGIYLVVSTQYPKDKYISTDIKMNIPGRMCFSVPDLQASVCMVENGEAVSLYPPPGRGIFAHGVNRFKFQSPFISDGQLAEIIKNAKEGKTSGKLAAATELTEDELVKWSLTENNSFLGQREAFREFGGRMEWNELVKMLSEMENKIYQYADVQYQVKPGGSHNARRLEQIAIVKDGSFVGPCPECGAPRKQTPCEFCGVG